MFALLTTRSLCKRRHPSTLLYSCITTLGEVMLNKSLFPKKDVNERTSKLLIQNRDNFSFVNSYRVTVFYYDEQSSWFRNINCIE